MLRYFFIGGICNMVTRRILAFLGFVAFAVGLLTAVIAAMFAPEHPAIIFSLIILGIIVGILNITSKEINTLLIATIALIVVGNVFEPIKAGGIGLLLDNMLGLFATLMAPAAVIVAIRALFNVGLPGEEKTSAD